MPAYNAAKTLVSTYRDIPGGVVDEVILVDDVSQDETVEIARTLPMRVVAHVQNLGYGGNQKTCYLEALKHGADVIVMLHPDHQYDSTRVPALIEPLVRGEAEVVLGSRFLEGKTLEWGMPKWKYVANRFLSTLQNVCFRQKLSEYHTGMRAFSRAFLERTPFLINSNDFVFDAEMLSQAVIQNARIAEVSVPGRYFEEASSINFGVSVRYGFGVLGTCVRVLLHKSGLRKDPIYSKTLKDVLSPQYWGEVFREPTGQQGAEAG